tara:strand:- start:935 stop:1231 length:297 start_codon:yes stop_codon:yes gene_type:complete
MASNSSDISLLESKIIILLNKLKDNHLDLQTLKERNKLLDSQKELLEGQIKNLKEENKSLKIANNLLGSNEGKKQTKAKINSLIKEVDYCISQLSEMN